VKHIPCTAKGLACFCKSWITGHFASKNDKTLRIHIQGLLLYWW